MTSGLSPAENEIVTLLRQMYSTVDASVSEAIQRAEYPPVCAAGCGHCCAQPIPATPLEVLGIRLYLRQHAPDWRQQCGAGNSTACIFLSSKNQCLVYPFRPIACRRYMVCRRVCTAGEDPTTTRPEDVLRPSRQALLRALHLSASFYERHKLLPASPHSMEDFRNISALLASLDWS